MKKIVCIASILLISGSFSCLACKCGSVKLTPETYFEYNVIFSGTLDTIVDTGSYLIRDFTFTIQTMYKGDSTHKITFRNISQGSCMEFYKKGLTYLIYLRYSKKTKRYYTQTCRSMKMKSKAEYYTLGFQTDTLWGYVNKYYELVFLEQLHKTKNGLIEIKTFSDKPFIQGTVTNCLPTGTWTFYDFNGKIVETINYKKGRKFREKIVCR